MCAGEDVAQRIWGHPTVMLPPLGSRGEAASRLYRRGVRVGWDECQWFEPARELFNHNLQSSSCHLDSDPRGKRCVLASNTSYV
jgi:hypothetical protein